MKMIIAVVNDQDAGKLSSVLMEKKYGVTKLSSTGGFLRSGNTTLMIGLDDDKVEEVKQIIKENCQARKQFATPLPVGGNADSYLSYPVEVTVGGATLFVLPIEQFHKF